MQEIFCKDTWIPAWHGVSVFPGVARRVRPEAFGKIFLLPRSPAALPLCQFLLTEGKVDTKFLFSAILAIPLIQCLCFLQNLAAIQVTKTIFLFEKVSIMNIIQLIYYDFGIYASRDGNHFFNIKHCQYAVYPAFFVILENTVWKFALYGLFLSV